MSCIKGQGIVLRLGHVHFEEGKYWTACGLPLLVKNYLVTEVRDNVSCKSCQRSNLYKGIDELERYSRTIRQ